MKINKAYKFRLDPSPGQEIILNKSAGSSRFVYNYFLKLNLDIREAGGKFLSANTMVNMLPELKDQFPFLKDVFSQSLQGVLRNLSGGFDRFFIIQKETKGYSRKTIEKAQRLNKSLRAYELSGHPKFKKKGIDDSFIVPQKFRIIQDLDRIMIPKAGLVRYFNSREIYGLVKSVTVSKKNGKWYVSVLTEQELIEKEKTSDKPIGIDVGLKSFAFLSNGIEIENPKYYRKLEEKLKKAQRKLSSKVLKSKNWYKQKLVVSKIQEKIANSRYDFLHKESSKIVNSQDLIGIEDLNINGLVKNKHLAKSIHDVGWGKFNSMLEYKTFFQSKILVRVGRFYPSSQLCSNPDCDGKKLMPLHLRTYVCESCNTIIDRDYNASKNIENEAIRLYKFSG